LSWHDECLDGLKKFHRQLKFQLHGNDTNFNPAQRFSPVFGAHMMVMQSRCAKAPIIKFGFFNKESKSWLSK